MLGVDVTLLHFRNLQLELVLKSLQSIDPEMHGGTCQSLRLHKFGVQLISELRIFFEKCGHSPLCAAAGCRLQAGLPSPHMCDHFGRMRAAR